MAESKENPNQAQGPARVEITKFSDRELFRDFQTELNAAVGGISTILKSIQNNTSGIPDAVAFYADGGYNAQASRKTVADLPEQTQLGPRPGASASGQLILPAGMTPPTPPFSPISPAAPPTEAGGPSGGDPINVNRAATEPGSVFSKEGLVQHIQSTFSSALTPIGASQSLWTPPFQKPQPGDSNYQVIPEGQSGAGDQINPATQAPYSGWAGAAAKYGAQYALPAAIWNGVGPVISIDPGALSQWGQQLGTPQGQGSTNVGPFQVPLNSLWHGISDVASSAWTGLTTPGVSTQQVMQGKTNLADLGWTNDNPMYGQLSSGINDLTQFGGSRLGLNPDTTELLDQSTRYGTTSLESMVTTLKKIPDAAKAAQVSWEQQLADMKSLGELYNSQGGTVAAAAKFTNQWTQGTGLPASVAEQALQNPFVQSVGTMQTGLMPQLQGLMSPGQRIDQTYGAVNQMYDAMSGMPTTNSAIAGPGGFSRTIGGNDQAIALTAQFTGLKPEVVKAMTDPKLSAGIQSGAALGDAFKSWRGRTNAGGRKGAEAWSLDPTGQGKDLGDMVKQLQSARNLHGDPMFSSKEIDRIRGISKDTPGIRQAAFKDLEKSGYPLKRTPITQEPSTGGRGVQVSTSGGRLTHFTESGENVFDTRAGKTALARAVAQRQGDQVQKLVHEGAAQGAKAQKIMERGSMGAAGGSSPGVTIELTKSAQKMIQFKGKPGQTKIDAGAGNAATNMGFTPPTYINSNSGGG